MSSAVLSRASCREPSRRDLPLPASCCWRCRAPPARDPCHHRPNRNRNRRRTPNCATRSRRRSTRRRPSKARCRTRPTSRRRRSTPPRAAVSDRLVARLSDPGDAVTGRPALGEHDRRRGNLQAIRVDAEQGQRTARPCSARTACANRAGSPRPAPRRRTVVHPPVAGACRRSAATPGRCAWSGTAHPWRPCSCSAPRQPRTGRHWNRPRLRAKDRRSRCRPRAPAHPRHRSG